MWTALKDQFDRSESVRRLLQPTLPVCRVAECWSQPIGGTNFKRPVSMSVPSGSTSGEAGDRLPSAPPTMYDMKIAVDRTPSSGLDST